MQARQYSSLVDCGAGRWARRAASCFISIGADNWVSFAVYALVLPTDRVNLGSADELGRMTVLRAEIRATPYLAQVSEYHSTLLQSGRSDLSVKPDFVTTRELSWRDESMLVIRHLFA